MPVPKNSSRKTERRSRGDGRGKLFPPLFVIASLSALLGAGVWLSSTNSLATDPATLCRTDVSPPSINLVLIDVTDSLSIDERSQITNEITRIKDGVQRFGLLEVYSLGQNYDDLREPIISVCNPGRGSEMSTIYQNPELVEQRWLANFSDRLQSAVELVVNSEASNQSLILESIRALTITRFGNPTFDSSSKNLYVFSDFLQHTPNVFSHYNRPFPSYQEFRETPYFSEIRSDMRGVNVTAFYIARPATISLQDEIHVQFWLDHFSGSGASVERVKRIFGN